MIFLLIRDVSHVSAMMQHPLPSVMRGLASAFVKMVSLDRDVISVNQAFGITQDMDAKVRKEDDWFLISTLCFFPTKYCQILCSFSQPSIFEDIIF